MASKITGSKTYRAATASFDGASEGMGIMHMLGEVDPKDLKIGMKVKAVWKKAEERTGAITDILYFKPVAAKKKAKKKAEPKSKGKR